MRQNDLPLVSVIIPTYNRADMLIKAVESVSKQSYKSIEIIIIDDGSTDGTDRIIKEIKKNNENIVYYSKPNGGCSSARNMGLKLAHGEIIAFLDSDDQYEPKAIEMLISKMEESDAEFVYSPSIEIYPNKKWKVNLPVTAGVSESLAKTHFMNTNIRNGSYVFSRSKLGLVGELDESLRFNEDSDYVQRLLIHSKTAYLPIPTIRVLYHANSKSRNRIEIYKALLQSSEKILVQNPEFATELGEAAEKRINQIKTNLIEAFIMENKYPEAIIFKEGMKTGLRLTIRLSIKLKTNRILGLETVIKKVFKKIKNILSFSERDETKMFKVQKGNKIAGKN